MIKFNKANAVVSMWIQEMSEGACEICSIQDKPYGWVFFYISKNVAVNEQGVVQINNAPVIFDRVVGEIIVTGTERETEYYIQQYEASLTKERLALTPEPSNFVDRVA